MNFYTAFLLLLSFFAAVGVSFFQYFYKSKLRSNTVYSIAILRFFAVFGLLLLLINPIITRSTLEIIKTPLPIIIDNSGSISNLKATLTAVTVFNTLQANTSLKNKFDVQPYAFDADFKAIANATELSFTGKQTALDEVAKNLKSKFKNQHFPTILVTDGNQTSGADFVYSFDPSNKIFPVVVGDTTQFADLNSTQINVNKYAFYKNKFPIEVFLNYSGTKPITTNFKILQGATVLYTQKTTFSSTNKSVIINALLPANTKGLQTFTALVQPFPSEKNTYNNAKKFAVEVLDQKSEIALIAAINHPDLGALKRSIETNSQRKVTIIKPQDTENLQKFNVLVMYQPNSSFKSVFEINAKSKINTFIITGNSTDFNFLNQYQKQVSFDMTAQKEDYLADFESNFNLFAIDNIGFNTFPPLENLFGSITSNQNSTVLLNSKIRNVPTDQPLLLFFDSTGARTAFLFGENSWKWRAQCFLSEKSFTKYDIFIDKIIQYLASNDAKKSLIVSHERFYNSGDALEIEAQYFNKNYEFDDKAQLTISVTNTKTKKNKLFDFLRTNSSYKVNLDGLEPGNYTFTVTEINSKASYKSTFEILDFDIEKQFVNANLAKLKQVSNQTNGATYMPDQVNQLIKLLLQDPAYNPIEKKIVTQAPIIDWVLLLILIAACLSAEWFIRKYNGML